MMQKLFCPEVFLSEILEKASESFFSEVVFPKVFRPKVFDVNVLKFGMISLLILETNQAKQLSNAISANGLYKNTTKIKTFFIANKQTNK